jgi:RNA polymerase sigma-70 factor (ECF subfamily)
VGLDETAQLLAAAMEGETDARGALLERLRPRIVLWAATRMSPKLRAKVEPDDVAQEVLLAVHKGLDAFEVRDHASFLAWLFRVAENRIRDLVDHFNAKKRQLPEPHSFTQTSPSSAAVRHERVERMRLALDDLPQDYREVIRLRRIQELECREVAAIMNRSENAVRVLYCRALKALGKRLDESE